MDIRDLGHANVAAANLTWIETVLMLVPDMTAAEADRLLPDVMTYHKTISLRMASHLKLTCDNISRTQWLSAQVLHMDPGKARIGARLLHDHLIRLRDSNCSAYEDHFRKSEVLMSQTLQFAEHEPPIRLWHGGLASPSFIVS